MNHPDQSDAADAKRLRWLLNGNGYFMEERGLCGHPPCDEDEQLEARKEIDIQMLQDEVTEISSQPCDGKAITEAIQTIKELGSFPKFTERVVISLGANDNLLLSNLKRDSTGKVLSGYVINGHWIIDLQDRQVLCQVDIPDDKKFTEYDYNDLIKWALDKDRIT